MPSKGYLLEQGNAGSPAASDGSTVAYWKCDEGSGTTAEDSTANNRDATLQGNPTWVSGLLEYGGDYAVDLDGTGDYLSVADDAAFSFGNGTTDSAFTVYGFCKLNSLSTATAFFSKYDVNGAAREYGIFFDTDGRIRFRIYDESSDGYLERRTDEVLDLNKRYFICCTYTGTAVATNLKIYLQGIQIDVATTSSGSYTAMEDTATAPMIGAFTDTGGTIKTLDGIVDNIVVRSDAMSAADIRALYNSTYPRDGSAFTENMWQLVCSETVEKAITTYNFPVPIYGDLDGGYKIEFHQVNDNVAAANTRMNINMVNLVTNDSVIYYIASVAAIYTASYTLSATIAGAGGGADNWCTSTFYIPFSAQGERFMFSRLSRASPSFPPVHAYQPKDRITTPGTTTEITSLGFTSTAIGGIGVGSRFKLYKLKNFS